MMGRLAFLSFILAFYVIGGQAESVALEDSTGYSYVDRLAQLEEDLIRKGVYVREGDSPMSRMATFKKPSKEAIELSLMSMKTLEQLKKLKQTIGNRKSSDGLALVRGPDFTLVNDTCIRDAKCPPVTKYRTMDGSCNSIKIPNLGKSLTVYRRLMHPDYSDGIQAPRMASDGSELPNARRISMTVFQALPHGPDVPLKTVTSSLMQFGQFINHDMEATNQFGFTDTRYSTGINCCDDRGRQLPPNERHPECFPIFIADDDILMQSGEPRPEGIRQNCMNFVRSITGPRMDCNQPPTGYADQLNSNTHWLDGSAIYGSDDATAKTLREFKGGRLLMSIDKSFNGGTRNLLPMLSKCQLGPCFTAGDSRATEQPQLAVMHTLWAREHNRVAGILASLNPTWTDETLFQEARRIVVGELQHITFNEFIPTLLSQRTIQRFDLAPVVGTGYGVQLSGVATGPISNEFATAAFRMGHSIVQGKTLLYDDMGNLLPSSYAMSSVFTDASQIVNDKMFLDNVIRGLVTQPSQAVDQMVADALWLELFKSASDVFGFDLVAFNIQRGRDHGIPSYNKYRDWCGLKTFSSFEDLLNPEFNEDGTPTMDPQVVKWIWSMYNSVDDIDLFVGLVSELAPNPVTATSGVVGPTLGCLLGENFSRVKHTDNYFYESGRLPNRFTLSQLDQIKKATLARIYCDNNDGSVKLMQPRAFNAADPRSNPKVRCDPRMIPVVDLSLWKGEPVREG